MKILLASLFSAALVCSSAQASILGQFDFNNVATVGSPNDPSCVAPCVELTPLTTCDLIAGLHTAGGPDDSAFRTYSGWDRTQYDALVYLNRSGTWQWPKTLAFEVQVDPNSLGAITGLSVDLKRPYSYSPDSIMASIFWEDDNGTVQQRNSGPVDITGATSWTNVSFDFDQGTAPLPTGVDYSGEQFTIELYAWGGNGGALYLDNVTLTGECAPVPEPGAVLLIATSGLVLLLRRRVRA